MAMLITNTDNHVSFNILLWWSMALMIVSPAGVWGNLRRGSWGSWALHREDPERGMYEPLLILVISHNIDIPIIKSI